MGINEFRHEIYANVDPSAILNVTKIWLSANQFKIKKEIPAAFINSYAGSYFGITDHETRRWLEIRVSPLPTGIQIALYEKVAAGGQMFGDLIKEEVLALATFLQSNLGGVPSLQQQQQQQVIAINVVAPPAPPPVPAQPQPALPSIFCIHCGSQNVNYAKFCKVCGASIE